MTADGARRTYDVAGHALRLAMFWGSASEALKVAERYGRCRYHLEADRQERREHEALVAELRCLARGSAA